jgi:hypothetical protein
MSEVVFVGTSDAFGAGGRRQSALLVRAPGRALLNVAHHGQASPRWIEREEIDTILVSHFHGMLRRHPRPAAVLRSTDGGAACACDTRLVLRDQFPGCRPTAVESAGAGQ